MRFWLLEESTRRELAASFRVRAVADPKLRADFNAGVKASRDQGPRNLSVVDGVAQISVEGVLTQEPDFWLWLFDIPNTSYDDIISAVATAERDPTIKRVVFDVNSPGGEVAGLFEVLAAMQAMQKPRSTNAQLAASAAYGIASMGGKVTATSHASTFGSVGVVATYLVEDDAIDITSTEAPDKRPDPSTDAGKATIRAYLDQVHQLFAENIAAGRGTTVEKVNGDYGRGAAMLAAEAKRRGMVDKVVGQRPMDAAEALRAIEAQPPPAPTDKREEPAPPITTAKDQQTATVEGAAQEQAMDEKTLKAQHPDVHEAVMKAGAEKERKRVNTLLTLGKNAKAMDIALKHVASGASVADEEVQGEFLGARLASAETTARRDDDAVAAAAVGTAGKPGEQASRDVGDQVADLMGLPALPAAKKAGA